VLISGAEIRAGSIPARFASSGTSDPTAFAQTQIPMIASPITAPKIGGCRSSPHVNRKPTGPRMRPRASPVVASRATTRTVSRG
jgi:hypothetical protein